jgi:stalled ribosome rescue protein Dom34
VIEEKKIMQKFFETLGKEIDKVAYGMVEVKKALEFGAVDILLVSEDLDEDVIEELEKKCEEYGTKLQLISNETREGKQLIDLGGVAALLRYAI